MSNLDDGVGELQVAPSSALDLLHVYVDSVFPEDLEKVPCQPVVSDGLLIRLWKSNIVWGLNVKALRINSWHC